MLFPVGVPVTGKNLVGRKKEVKTILDMIEIGQNMVLVSPRRYGKTSLLLEVSRRIKKKYFVAFVDIFRTASKRDLAYEIIDKIFENKKIVSLSRNIKEHILSFISKIEVKSVIKDFEFILKLIDEKDEDKLLNEAISLPEKFAEKYKKKIVCIFDEFGDVEKLDGTALLKKMRSVFQFSKNCIFIFSGSRESVLREIFKNNNSAFYNFARIMTLDVLPEEDFLNYIINRFAENKVKITHENAMFILSKTKAHPYYTQLLCQEIYLEVHGVKREINKKDIENAFNAILNQEKNYLEILWEQIKSRKDFVYVVKSICFEKNPYKVDNLERQQVFYILQQLERMGVIKKKGKADYSMIDPLFTQFVKEIVI